LALAASGTPLRCSIERSPSDAAVTASNPAGVFDEVALAAVRRWRFKPYEVDGQPVEAVTGTVMVFKPADDSDR
jgi:TonB family protein